MLAVVKRLIAGKDHVAALQQQIAALKTEGAGAEAEIDRLKCERAAAESYDEARELDERIARQIWVTEHCAAALPQLELQLAAARAWSPGTGSPASAGPNAALARADQGFPGRQTAERAPARARQKCRVISFLLGDFDDASG